MANEKTVITNREARRDFHIEKTYEAGLHLKGNEVKSLRNGQANLKGSFAQFDRGELFVYGMHISPYEYSREEYDPVRPKKLLLHKAEINQLAMKIAQQGYAVVPLKVYFRRGLAKMELGLGKGKKLHDKRKAIKEKEARIEVEKAMKERNR